MDSELLALSHILECCLWHVLIIGKRWLHHHAAAKAIPLHPQRLIQIKQPQVMAVPGSLLWDEKERAHCALFTM